MIDAFNTLIIALTLSWFIFDIYSLCQTILPPKARIIEAKVIEVIKTTGFHNAHLKLLIEIAGENFWVESMFRPNLRWWLQEIPSVNNTVQFCVCNNDKLMSNQTTLIYGISSKRAPSAAKLVYDLFYIRSNKFTILFIFGFILLFWAAQLFNFSPDTVIYHASIYWLCRVAVEALVV